MILPSPNNITDLTPQKKGAALSGGPFFLKGVRSVILLGDGSIIEGQPSSGHLFLESGMVTGFPSAPDSTVQ